MYAYNHEQTPLLKGQQRVYGWHEVDHQVETDMGWPG